MTLYKVLGPNGEAIHGGSGMWNLPDGKPGKWMPKIEGPQCCQRGYHLVELQSLADWLQVDCTIYEAQGKGPKDTNGSGKVAFSQARLLRQINVSEKDLRLFAADCAEHVLHLFEKDHPKDKRPRKAIEVARKFANSKATDKQRAAAWGAARDAARVAAWDAAWVAARVAAWVVAWDAAWDAARGAARDAAWAAARAAAPGPARVAAWDAAWGAARVAAWDAERQWQGAKLSSYLKAYD